MRSEGKPTRSSDDGPKGYPGVPGRLHKTWRNLPHWQLGGSTYFLTYRCTEGLTLSAAERTVVLDNWKYWHARRYHLHAVVVMPDHVHVLTTPLKESDGIWMSLVRILHTNKSFTAHEINRIGGRVGHVWQGACFDRVVRDEAEFWEKWTYMANNPVKAGLCTWPEEYPWWYANPEEDILGQVASVER